MGNPLVSILICCHNRREYIEQTLESVFAQRYEPVEIVVVDDGSTDGTRELMAGYGDKVKYHWQQRQGIAGARNTACRLAKGEYIAFQDDDDLMEPNRIIILYKALCKYPQAVLATGGYEIIDPEGKLTGSKNLPLYESGSDETVLFEDAYHAILWPMVPANPHTTLFRRSDGERIGWFDTTFTYSASDKDFLARLAQLGPLVYVMKTISYYRQGHSSIWSNKLRANYGSLQLWQKHLAIIKDGHDALKRRIGERSLGVLCQIALEESKGLSAPDAEAPLYRERAIALLDPVQRLKYVFYKSIKLPIRRLVKSNG